MTGREKGTRPMKGDLQVVGLRAPNAEDTMGVSAGGQWELASVVARWTIQLGTAPGRSKELVVILGRVTTVVGRGIFARIALSCQPVLARAEERLAGRNRTVDRPQHPECMSCLRMRTRLDHSKQSLVIVDLNLFQFSRIAWYGT